MKISERVREVWQYRDLIQNLVVRDLKVRYKNSFLGVAWSWLSPLLMMIVYTIFFTVLWGNDSIGHYSVFLLCGLLPWSFFIDAVVQSTASVVGNAHLIKKVYFPREILPISVVLSNLASFLISLPVFFLMVVISGAPLRWTMLLMPVTLLIQVIFILGLAFLLSTLNVLYRDTQHLLGIAMQAWFFLTPVFYPIETIPGEAHILGVAINPRYWLPRLNPMASLIASYRDVLYWGSPTGWDFLLRTAATAVAVFVVGYLFFIRHSARFGEEI